MNWHLKGILSKYIGLLFSLSVFLFYLVISLLSYIPTYCINVLPQFSIEVVFSELYETIFLVTLFGISITTLISQIFNIISNFYLIGNTKKECLYIGVSNTKNLDKYKLDISNPFLYSSKTRALLE